jgi:hypothetical protein
VLNESILLVDNHGQYILLELGHTNHIEVKKKYKKMPPILSL